MWSISPARCRKIDLLPQKPSENWRFAPLPIKESAIYNQTAQNRFGLNFSQRLAVLMGKLCRVPKGDWLCNIRVTSFSRFLHHETMMQPKTCTFINLNLFYIDMLKPCVAPNVLENADTFILSLHQWVDFCRISVCHYIICAT